MIDLTALNVFVMGTECGSFTLAAKSMEKTQSAVSQTVRQLEDYLGVVLIDRASRPMTLTPPGSILRERPPVSEGAS